MTTQFVNDQGEPVTFVGPTVVDALDDKDACQRLEVVAILCWDSHQAWERIISERDGDEPWETLSDAQRKEIADSVLWLTQHPTASVAAQHDAWRARKMLHDPSHPNLKPFDELPFSQQVKARLWRHVLLAIMG